MEAAQMTVRSMRCRFERLKAQSLPRGGKPGGSVVFAITELHALGR